MMRTAFVFSALALGASGCVTLTPVGPLAQSLGPPPEAVAPIDAGAKVTAPRDVAAKPMIQPAQPPAPPVTDVTPGEVTADNTAEIMQRLQAELDADRRAAEAMPRPSEVSVIK